MIPNHAAALSKVVASARKLGYAIGFGYSVDLEVKSDKDTAEEMKKNLQKALSSEKLPYSISVEFYGIKINGTVSITKLVTEKEGGNEV